MKWLILFVYVVCPAVCFSQIILTEIMYNPAGSERENEFIELYNADETEIDLYGWLLGDGQKINYIEAIDEHCILQPHCFAVLLVKKYYENSLVYESIIPPGTLRLTVEAAQFGGYGLNNSTAETISIFTPQNVLVDSCTYSLGNADGFSDEKIILDADNENNWTDSNIQNGTPGKINSVSPLDVDAALLTVQAPENIATDEAFSITLGIRNSGLTPFDSVEFLATIQDSVILRQLLTFATLEFQDTLSLEQNVPSLPAGNHLVHYYVVLQNDARPENDSCNREIHVLSRFYYNDVVINEVMYNTDEKSQEWIELQNTDDSAIDLNGWTLSDKSRTCTIADSSIKLRAGEFLVLCNILDDDTLTCRYLSLTLPELNNSGDRLLLQDAVGSTIDSLYYESSWGGERLKSMERRKIEALSTSPLNWGTCSDKAGHSAGRLNSISPQTHDASLLNLQIDGNYSQGDDVVIEAKILNCGRENIESGSISFHYAEWPDSEPHMIAEKNIPALKVDESISIFIEWQNAPCGKFNILAKLAAFQDSQPANDTLSCLLSIAPLFNTIVINELMPAPADNDHEWIELFNTSGECIDLCNWMISDSDTSDKVELSSQSFILPPNSFCVVGSDSGFCDLAIKNFPSLSNNGDAVFLYAANQIIIDAMNYPDNIDKGISLERINPMAPSDEITNWHTHAGSGHHSAGEPNSILISSVKQHSSLSAEPVAFSPDGDGFDDFAAIHYQLDSNINQVNLKIYDIRGRLVRFLLNNETSNSERTVFWDGRNDDGQRCRMGIYIVYLEAQDIEKKMQTLKTTVVLAGQL